MKLFDFSKFKSRIFQYLAALAANLGMLSIGLHYGWPSSAISVLKSGEYSFKMTEEEISWMIAVTPMGSVIGDVIAGFSMNIFGRKKMIWFSAIPLTVSWILIAVANSSGYLFAGRIIAGIVDGLLFTAIPPYLAEISDPEIRGFLGTTYLVTLVFGMLMSNVMLYFISIPAQAYIAGSVTLVMMIILPFLPESPYFYLLRSEVALAKESLQKFRGKGEVDDEIGRISKGIMEEEKYAKGGLKELFLKPQYRNCLFLALSMTSLQQLSGILGIQSYCQEVFQETSNIIDPKVANLIYYLLYFLATLVALVLIDISGRKPLVLFSSVVVCITLFTISAYSYIKNSTHIDLSGYEYIQIVAILVYICAYSIGLNCVPILVSSEIFPSHIKSKAFCVINLCYSVVSTSVVKYFSWSASTFSLAVPFFTFAIFSFASVIILSIFLPETKGKTLEDVQLQMRSNKLKKLEKNNYVI
uniref:Facilitated trehalose transporter Tret1-like n=1 Tax=Diabrotica virgifera virgifera TaxID=50390 RepID=A0A6P7F6V3_DIAVI